MIIYPAIDLLEGEAVRLYKGDYAQKTVYAHDPVSVALAFKDAGATHIHLVDLEGARTGETPHLELIARIKEEAGLFAEVGGGIRSLKVAERYLDRGLDRVILGTAAVTDEGFLKEALAAFGEKVAVGADFKDGYVAVKGWTQTLPITAEAFVGRMEELGVRTLIVTDISRDGAMQGSNRELYAQLAAKFSPQLIASGGVSSLEDIRGLRALGLHGAILGKAYYSGAVKLREAIEAANDQ